MCDLANLGFFVVENRLNALKVFTKFIELIFTIELPFQGAWP